MAYKILISYSWKNAGERRALTSEIGAIEGVEIISDKIITPGKKIHETISKMIDNCDCVIALLTPESISSREVMDELSRAHERKKFIVPVLRNLITTDEIPWYLRDVRQLRYTEEQFDNMLDDLLLLIKVTVQPSCQNISRKRVETQAKLNTSIQEKPYLVARVWVKSGESIHFYTPAFLWSASAWTMIGHAGNRSVKRAAVNIKSTGVIYKLSFPEIKEIRIMNIDKETGIVLRVETLSGKARQGQLLPPDKDELSGGQISYTISENSIPRLGGKDEDDAEVSIQLEDISRIEFGKD